MSMGDMRGKALIAEDRYVAGEEISILILSFWNLTVILTLPDTTY